MKKFFLFLLFIMTFANVAMSEPNSGSFWVKTFEAGSSDVNYRTVEKDGLNRLRTLSNRRDIVITLYGHADLLDWLILGQPVGKKVSRALDGGIQNARVVAVMDACGIKTGQVETQVGNEKVRGVLVVWRLKGPSNFELAGQIKGVANDLAQHKAENLEWQKKYAKKLAQTDEKVDALMSKTATHLFVGGHYTLGDSSTYTAGLQAQLNIPFGVTMLLSSDWGKKSSLMLGGGYRYKAIAGFCGVNLNSKFEPHLTLVTTGNFRLTNRLNLMLSASANWSEIITPPSSNVSARTDGDDLHIANRFNAGGKQTIITGKISAGINFQLF